MCQIQIQEEDSNTYNEQLCLCSLLAIKQLLDSFFFVSLHDLHHAFLSCFLRVIVFFEAAECFYLRQTGTGKVAHFLQTSGCFKYSGDLLVLCRVAVCIMRGETGHAWRLDSLEQNKGM